MADIYNRKRVDKKEKDRRKRNGQKREPKVAEWKSGLGKRKKGFRTSTLVTCE